MTDHMIKPAPAKQISRMILLAFLVGPKAVQAVDFQASQSDGIDDAKDSTVALHRDPFWPVGYTPKWVTEKQQQEQGAAVVKQPESIDWNKAMEQVAIQGVSSRAGNEFYAVINGQVRSTGETVSVQIGEVSYTWMIDGISPPSSVKLRRVSAGQQSNFSIMNKEGNGYENN